MRERIILDYGWVHKMRTFEVRIDTKTIQVVQADEFVEAGPWFIFRTNGSEAARFAKASVVSIMDQEAKPKREITF